MAAMARPVVVVVDAEDASRQAVARELEGRYGAHYRIMSSASPEEALAALEQLRGEGADVPLVLADQWMPGRTGAQFLARAAGAVHRPGDPGLGPGAAGRDLAQRPPGAGHRDGQAMQLALIRQDPEVADHPAPPAIAHARSASTRPRS
jgi:hypothetical protein